MCHEKLFAILMLPILCVCYDNDNEIFNVFHIYGGNIC